MPSKALLLLDNAPSHPNEKDLVSEDGSILAMFMPPNVTPLIQPMDQNAIRITKLHYRNSLLAAVFESQCNVIESVKKITLRDAVTFLHSAWNKVGQQTLAKCWKPILSIADPFEEEDNIPLNLLKSQMNETRRLARAAVDMLEKMTPEVSYMLKSISFEVKTLHT